MSEDMGTSIVVEPPPDFRAALVRAISGLSMITRQRIEIEDPISGHSLADWTGVDEILEGITFRALDRVRSCIEEMSEEVVRLNPEDPEVGSMEATMVLLITEFGHFLTHVVQHSGVLGGLVNEAISDAIECTGDQLWGPING